MTKTQIWEEVQKLLTTNQTKEVANKKEVLLYNALELLLAPKSGGNNTLNPPKEIEGIMHYYCRFHAQYEPQESMVMSQDKSKGYCKASISIWNKTNSSIKKLDSQMSELVSKGEFEKAQEIALESKALKTSLNDPKSYDFDEDWKVFNS